MQMSTLAKTVGGGSGIILASALLLTQIGEREGVKNEPYRDVTGTLTVCAGVTGSGVVAGKTYTAAECNALTLNAVTEHGKRLLACITVPITQGYYEALASWAYNVGTGAACKSTLMRLLNLGLYRGACDELLKWDMAGGRHVPGILRRRVAERDECLKAVPAPVVAVKALA
jgi:lysozyme